MQSKSPYRGSDRERVKKGEPLLYDPCFKNVINTEVCSLKELVTPTDFVWWFFTDEWKLFRSHVFFGFMERCTYKVEELYGKIPDRAPSTFTRGSARNRL